MAGGGLYISSGKEKRAIVVIATAIHKNTTTVWVFEISNPQGQNNILPPQQQERQLPQIFYWS